MGRLKFDFHTAAGGARAAADPVEVEGGIRLEEALSREPAEVVEESREGTVVEEEEAEARGRQQKRKRAARLGEEAEADLYPSRPTRAPVVPRAVAAAAAPARREGLQRRAAAGPVARPRP